MRNLLDSLFGKESKIKPLYLGDRIADIAARYGMSGEICLMGFRDESGNHDSYNDFIGLLSNGFLYVFRGTVDPGPYWTDPDRRKKKGWPDGCAHVCNGLHRKVYQVATTKKYGWFMRQVGNLSIWRDYDGDFIRDANETTKVGKFQIHIHYGKGDSIGGWSAGCQVILGKENMNEFIELIKDSDIYRRNKNHLFDYLILDRADVPWEEIKNAAR